MAKIPDLASLRASITRLTAERLALAADHRGQDEARADVAHHTQTIAAELDQRWAYGVGAGLLKDAFVVRPRPDGVVDLGPLLAAVFGPGVLAAALDRYVDRLPQSVDQTARAARLAEVSAELAEVEDAEEIEVLRLEALGLSPGRRADARPEVVLKRRA